MGCEIFLSCIYLVIWMLSACFSTSQRMKLCKQISRINSASHVPEECSPQQKQLWGGLGDWDRGVCGVWGGWGGWSTAGGARKESRNCLEARTKVCRRAGHMKLRVGI